MICKDADNRSEMGRQGIKSFDFVKNEVNERDIIHINQANGTRLRSEEFEVDLSHFVNYTSKVSSFHIDSYGWYYQNRKNQQEQSVM